MSRPMHLLPTDGNPSSTTKATTTTVVTTSTPPAASTTTLAIEDSEVSFFGKLTAASTAGAAVLEVVMTSCYFASILSPL